MMAGDLPPSSSETFFRLPAAACTISLPTSVEPVNATLSTSGCAAIAAPAVSPNPVRMLTTPGGKSASRNSSTRLLVAAKWQRRIEHVVAIDPYRAGANSVGQPVCQAAFAVQTLAARPYIVSLARLA